MGGWADQSEHPWLDVGLEPVGGHLAERLRAEYPDEDQGYSPFNVGGRWRHWEFLWLDKEHTRLVAFKPFYPTPDMLMWDEHYYKVEYVPSHYRDMMIPIWPTEDGRTLKFLDKIFPTGTPRRKLAATVSSPNRPPSEPLLPLPIAAWVAVMGIEP